jgi:hypothetical protein
MIVRALCSLTEDFFVREIVVRQPAKMLSGILSLAAVAALMPSARLGSASVPASRWVLRTPLTLLVAGDDADADGTSDDDVTEAQIFRKKRGTFQEYKPKDNRDKLLYDVTEVTPPPTKLGKFKLEPSAGVGDLMIANDQTYVIQKVSYRYTYEAGALRMFAKGAAVKKASREATESFLRRMLPTEGDGVSPPAADGSSDADEQSRQRRTNGADPS